MYLQNVIRAASRIMSVSFLMLLLMITASAYTIVTHGGRRIEIPSRFVVTPTTLTYEISQGIQITLQIAAIDIPATEIANNEAPGSFLRRMQLGTGASSKQEPNAERDIVARGTRTITNRDLAASMRRRRESEVAYERRRRELGLPSVEDSRKRAAVESELIGKELEQTLVAERETETYWRARASALRADIAAVDAELDYTRARLDEVPFLNSGGSFTTLSSIAPYSFGNVGNIGYIGGRRPFFSPYTQRPPVYLAPHSGSQITGRVGFGGRATRGQVFLNPGTFRYARPIGFGTPHLPYPDLPAFGSTFPPDDFTYERGELITRFDELAGIRAGLSARWRELEDEARRAGASPGWLRP